jgi:hypothetical protein
MHTFFKKRIKPLKMHRLKPQQLGPTRLEMISLLATSHDPFASLLFTINIEPCNEMIKAISSKAGMKITLFPVINKMLACGIFENPIFNQIILGNGVYQMEEIHIANVVLIPGTEAITYIVLENPHLKSLETIQRELLLMMVGRKKEYAKMRNSAAAFFARLCVRTGLFKVIGEKRAFTIGFERGLLSNISLSIHIYTTPANFILVKDVLTPMNMTPRFHACGPVRRPCVENDTVVSRETISLHITADHRLINGIHVYKLDQYLERIASNPEKYLL